MHVSHGFFFRMGFAWVFRMEFAWVGRGGGTTRARQTSRQAAQAVEMDASCLAVSGSKGVGVRRRKLASTARKGNSSAVWFARIMWTWSSLSSSLPEQ